MSSARCSRHSSRPSAPKRQGTNHGPSSFGVRLRLLRLSLRDVDHAKGNSSKPRLRVPKQDVEPPQPFSIDREATKVDDEVDSSLFVTREVDGDLSASFAHFPSRSFGSELHALASASGPTPKHDGSCQIDRGRRHLVGRIWAGRSENDPVNHPNDGHDSIGILEDSFAKRCDGHERTRRGGQLRHRAYPLRSRTGGVTAHEQDCVGGARH